MSLMSRTLSSSSLYSGPDASSEAEFSNLPVMDVKKRIVEKIAGNRVTLIVGEAGCGKSSQVPQFLLEAGMAPILCTQPRRFAVVAVAEMVAKARGCELGEEVGYHIGHLKVLSSRSKIIFKTAGVLLDEMRDKGLAALKYKVIILDEIHERSVESDLVLVCVRQFLMRNKNMRLLLMSATADITKYKDYFKDLGRGERIEVLAIPSKEEKTVFQRKAVYLDQVAQILGIGSQDLSMRYCSGSNPSYAKADIMTALHQVIHNLVIHIHENEPDIEKSILIFLPTYHSLVQQWHLLKPLASSFKVHILHSSIDTEKALMAMKIWKSHRKVILATNIAESSVTIPKAAFVIDSCRSLQVTYDRNRKKDSAVLIWISKSQAEQRRGRTGRTCHGRVYRLVTSSFYNQLPEHECPAILTLSLKQQVLLVCCAESRAINDPKVLLQKALDSPDPGVVQDALDLLVHIRALEKTSRGRYEPTYYGRLLASFSLSFDASVLIIKFGDIGMLREGILLGVLMDTQPLPILQPFGDENSFWENIMEYFSGEDNLQKLATQREMILMANLCAFQFWQCVFKDKHRLEHLKQLLKSEYVDTETWLPPSEGKWCSYHNLVPSALHQVAEIYEDVLNSVHLFRPKFLGTSDGTPTYHFPSGFIHRCRVECIPCEETDTLGAGDPLTQSRDTRRCVHVPFVDSGQFKCTSVTNNFATVVKQMRMQLTDVPDDDDGHTNIGEDNSSTNEAVPMCIYYVKGSCNRGNECPFSHSEQAKMPICKYFSSLQGCRNGDACSFSHDLGLSAASHRPGPCSPEDDSTNVKSLLCLFPPPSPNRCVLLLDDIDLYFSRNIARYFDPSRIIATSSYSKTSGRSEQVRVFWELEHPYETIISKAGKNPIPWSKVKCVLWFPNMGLYGGDLDTQKRIVWDFFEYLAFRLLADDLYEVQVILTMNNFRFAQLQVEKLGKECFFILKESFPFDERHFGLLPDTVTANKPLLKPKAVSYIFRHCPPSSISKSDYVSLFRSQLHSAR